MRPRLLAFTCLAAFTLSACGDGNEQPATGETLEPAPTVSSSPTASATPKIGRGELPSGFPRKEVPLISDGLVGGAETEGQFAVTFKPKNVEAAEERAVRLLARAGYRMVDEQETGDNSSSVLTNDTWQVSVAASPAGILYLVAPAG